MGALELTALDYKRLFETPFTRVRLPEIKFTLRQRGVKFRASGRKRDLYDLLAADLLQPTMNDPDAALAAIKIQAIFRGWRVRQTLVRRGPAAYNRNLCNNAVDPVTMDDINDIETNQFFSYQDRDGKVYGFEVASIGALVEKGLMENPFNRLPFTEDTLRKIAACKRHSITSIKTACCEEDGPPITPEQAVRRKAFELFHNFYLLTGCFVDEEWFMALDRQGLILLYRCAFEWWRYRGGLTPVQRRQYLPPGVRVLNQLHDVWYRQALNTLKLQQTLLADFHTLITGPRAHEDRTTAVYWILSALCQVSPTAAMALPQLAQ